MSSARTSGVLLLFHRPVGLRHGGATTVTEHIEAFGRHSAFPVYPVNTDLGFPAGLANRRFDAVVLHYSLFGVADYALDDGFLSYLAASRGDSYLVAFFQDEFRFCRRRFRFLREFEVDCIFSCLESPYLEEVYGDRTRATRLLTNVPGYVSHEMLEAARRFAPPPDRRTHDVVYRGRRLPAYAGRGGREKYVIGERFRELTSGSGLVVDIAGGEADRIYGDDWYRFLARSRAVLGTESGVDVFDLEDEVTTAYQRLIAQGVGEPTVEMLADELARWEGRIRYRTISPRHFEAAALGVCQVLFEGRYSGAMEPMKHYIPLRKDFGNLDDVLERLADHEFCAELATNARRDLIESGRWGYPPMIAGFDTVLREAGLDAGESREPSRAVLAEITGGRRGRLVRRYAGDARVEARAAVRSKLGPVVRPLRDRLRGRAG